MVIKNKCLIWFALTGILYIFFMLPGKGLKKNGLCYAGNKKHVINRVEELDTVNKQIMKNIPDLPDSGCISVKAHVVDSEKDPQIVIIEKKIEPLINEEYNFYNKKDTTGH